MSETLEREKRAPVEAPWPVQRAPIDLGHFSTQQFRQFLTDAKRPVLLWLVGSTEPHGPHLPLNTDVVLAEENARRAAHTLRSRGVEAVVAPPLPYGVTDFARGFPGAITVSPDTLVDLICDAVAAFLADGFKHVCLINHHLEPKQIHALQSAKARIIEWHGLRAVSLPEVMSKRWGRQLGDEFRSGACHAGQYETSLMLAARPRLVDQRAAEALPELEVSLSKAIAAGQGTFLEAGMREAYTGRPAEATREEGEQLYRVLTGMVVTEVMESLEMR